MTKNELNNRYFDWMYQLVCNAQYTKRKTYYHLIRRLHEIEFEYTIPLDGNRAEDGVDLRYRFGYELSLEGPVIASYLDDRPCSVLEMLIALAIRCEEHIMEDYEVGNRTGQWFWTMINNLGLIDMDDRKYDEEYVDMVITRLLNREYGRHGEGGLFTVDRRGCDLRTVDIWYQMNWYLSGNM